MLTIFYFFFFSCTLHTLWGWSLHWATLNFARNRVGTWNSSKWAIRVSILPRKMKLRFERATYPVKSRRKKTEITFFIGTSLFSIFENIMFFQDRLTIWSRLSFLPECQKIVYIIVHRQSWCLLMQVSFWKLRKLNKPKYDIIMWNWRLVILKR